MDLAQDGSRAGRLRAERIRRADSCPRVVSRHLHAAAPPLHHHVSHEPVHDLYHTRITRHGRGIAGVARDRKCVVSGKRVSVRVDLAGRSIIKTKKYDISAAKRHEIRKSYCRERCLKYEKNMVSAI